MQELLEILDDIKPGVDFKNETQLVDKGILDSLAVIRLVSELDDAFDVEIKVTDLVPENFNSAQAIFDLVKKLEDED